MYGHASGYQKRHLFNGLFDVRILTGERPAQSESPLATMYKQINDAPLQLHERRAALSKERQLEMVVLKAIAKRPEDRYSSFAELRSALMYSVLLPFK